VTPIQTLLARIAKEPECDVQPPAGLPALHPGHLLPADVRELYERAGGITLYEGASYVFTVLPPGQVVPLSQALAVALDRPDPSDAWYTIVLEGSEYISVDCTGRYGSRCYDNFHEFHPGEAPVIAWSFTELLTRLVEDRGAYPYWLRQDFRRMGDGYDDGSP
jgi:hypothetical protein